MSEESIDPHSGEDGVETVVAGVPAGAAADKAAYELTEDGNIAKIGDRKYVREEALHEARTKAQNYANTLKSLEPLMPEFEEFLASKQGNRNATVHRATTAGRAAPDSDYNDDELTGYAITRGYYDGDNKPDLKRAKDDLDIMTAIADRRAGRAVRPVAEASRRDKAEEHYRDALGARFVDGDPIADEKYVRAAFDAIPEEMRADPGIAQTMQVVAAGLQALDERRSGRAPRSGRREPVFREGAGGSRNYDGGDELDALDRAAAKARGKTPEQWSKMSKSLGGRSGGGTSFGGTVLEEV